MTARQAPLPLRMAAASAIPGALGVTAVAALAAARGAMPLGPVMVGALGVAMGAVAVGLAACTTQRSKQRAALDAQRLASATNDAERLEMGPILALDETAALARALASLREKIAEGVARDQRAREEAEDADRYKTEFLTAVSHELRTPLNAILGFADVLLRELDGPLAPGAREDVATIHTAGTHLRELFEDVIDLSTLASSRITLQREPLEVRPLLESVVRLLEGQRRDKPVELLVAVDAATPKVDADPKRLRQIVTNLGTNALKFTERGSVRFEAHGDGDEVVIIVRDTGSGISRQDLATLFTEYTQVGEVRRRTRGTGLGLAICKLLSELHGGGITVESDFGEGSAFIVRLPAARERGAP